MVLKLERFGKQIRNPSKFLFSEVVLEKDGEDQLDWSCEKWSIRQSRGQKHHVYCKMKEG